MKIIKFPCDTRVECEVCKCIYEFDNNDVCVENILFTNLEGEYIQEPKMYVICPFCRTKKMLEIKGD